VTRLLEWDLQSHQGTSCRSKDDASRWIACSADTGPQVCDPTSPCQRRRTKPIKVCYRARQVVPEVTDAALFESIYGRPPTTESCAVCFALRIASRPFFIERVEVGARIGSTHPSEMLPLSVNSSVNIELVVADDLGGRAYVYLEENPGAPGGSSMTESNLVPYNGQQFQGNAYRSFFRFTPSLMKVGTLSTVCFVAVNDNDMRSDKRCYTLDVRAAVVQWKSQAVAADGSLGPEEGRPPDMARIATVGCEYEDAISLDSPLYVMHVLMHPRPECSSCVPGGIVGVRMCNASVGGVGGGAEQAHDNEGDVHGEDRACCGNGRCDGHEMGHTCPQDCPPDDLSLVQTKLGDAESDPAYQSKATLRFRPRRGMEGRTLLMCVAARAATQGGFASIIQLRTANNAPTLCYVMKVERCSFCMRYGSNIKAASDTLLFNQHWLRLYNSNPALPRPDSLPASQRLAIGPLYQVASGDTVIAIAAMAKTTVKAILVNNPDLSDVQELPVGSELCLPLCSAPAI